MAVRLGLRMVKGLGEESGQGLADVRGAAPYRSVEEVRRRADVPAPMLERLAEADAFRGMALSRRQASWAVRDLADGVLPLFAAADGAGPHRSEATEPTVPLVPMREGREVVEDYRTVGLTLGRHPLAFLRPALRGRGITACVDIAAVRDGRKVTVSGIVLVRQKPGSAKGVMFITVEDATGMANLVLWPDRFEKQRTLVLSAGMIACHGRSQREGEVTHVITDRLEDLSGLLASVGERGEAFPLVLGRGDGATHPASRDPRDGPGAVPSIAPARDTNIPNLRHGSGAANSRSVCQTSDGEVTSRTSIAPDGLASFMRTVDPPLRQQSLPPCS